LLAKYVHLDHIAVLQLGSLGIRGEGREVANGVVDGNAGGETNT